MLKIRSDIQNLSEIISPQTTIFFHFCFLAPLFIVFEPSVYEFVVMYIVDSLAFLVFQKPEQYLFLKIFPKYKYFFPKFDVKSVNNLSVDKKNQFLECVFNFPNTRAFYTYLLSFLKIVPGALIIIFYWESQSTLNQFLKFMGYSLITCSYFYGVVFIESHVYLSKKLKEIHSFLNWDEVWINAPIPKLRRDINRQNILVGTSIFILLFVLQMIILNSSSEINSEIILKLLSVTILSFLLMGHFYFLTYRFLKQGFETMFSALENLDYSNSQTSLPFHSTELLARFEKSFNLLVHRLKIHEQQLIQSARKEAEKDRYHTLGEITGLVTHDLSSAMHAFKFMADEILSSNSPETLSQLKIHIDRSYNRANELITAIKFRLKNTDTTVQSVKFEVSHNNIVNLLETIFYKDNFFAIQFQIDPRLKNLFVAIPAVEFTQVLENIYKNAVSNLLTNKIAQPVLSVFLEKLTATHAEIIISDNGTGLSVDQFESMTNINNQNFNSLSLGLNLTRRLINNYGGKLDILPTSAGTSFKLILPIDYSYAFSAEKNNTNNITEGNHQCEVRA